MVSAVWEKHKLMVFENRVLRRIFGPKRDGVTGGWKGWSDGRVEKAA
jgi:hypothetical protein